MINYSIVLSKHDQHVTAGQTHCHNERVAEGRTRVGELVGKLDVVSVEPTSRYHSESVGAGHASLGEEPSHQVTNESSHSVGCKDLKVGTIRHFRQD
jgi:hypothetical protein